MNGMRFCGARRHYDAAGCRDQATGELRRPATAWCSTADERRRRRIVLTGEKGTRLLLDLEKPVTLRDGDGLALDDGTVVQVAGQAELLVEVSAKAGARRRAARLAHRQPAHRHPVRRQRLPHPARSCAGRDAEGPRRDDERRSRRRSIPSPRRRTHIVTITIMSDDAGAAALYRLMAWLSPAYPVGAFSYSGGIEWAVESGDIKDAETLKRWLAVVIARGRRLLRCGVLRSRASRDRNRRRQGAARGRRACGGVRAVQGAPSGNDRAGPCLRGGDARRVAVRRARSAGRGVGRAGRLSGRGRRRGGRPWRRG